MNLYMISMHDDNYSDNDYFLIIILSAATKSFSKYGINKVLFVMLSYLDNTEKRLVLNMSDDVAANFKNLSNICLKKTNCY